MYISIEDPINWIPKAACKDLEKNLFYPLRGQSTLPAKKVCYTCPVRIECLEYALALTEKLGVWGGCSERERRRIRRARNLARKAGLVDRLLADDDVLHNDEDEDEEYDEEYDDEIDEF